MNVLALKEAVRARDGYRCTACGMTNQEHIALHGRQLDVHRKTPGSLYAADETCTTLCIGCHGPQPRRERGQPDLACTRLRLSLHVYVPPPLRRAIEEAAERNRRSLTAELEIALEKHLKELGLWPPPPP
jgi:hypothetical protein